MTWQARSDRAARAGWAGGGCCRPHKRTVRLLATVNRLQAVHQVQ